MSPSVESNTGLKDWKSFLLEFGGMDVWDWRVETGVAHCLPGWVTYLLHCDVCEIQGLNALKSAPFVFSDTNQSIDVNICNNTHPHYSYNQHIQANI